MLWCVHAFRDVLRSELASCAPQVGDKVSISYGGRHEKGYYLYRVRRVDGKPRQIDWARFDAEAVKPDVPKAGRSIADRAQDDLPF